MKIFSGSPRNFLETIKKHPVFAATLLALTIRLSIILIADFPLNDGGLFYTMTNDLKNSGFVLPFFTSYNGGQIPFAYPPLSFYLAGGISYLFPISLVDVFHYLPFLISLATVPAFFLLAKSLLGENKAILATFVFVLLPRSFIWIIMGGGIARSLGLLFYLLTIFLGIKFYKTSKSLNFFLASTFMSLTLLSHLEWYFFASFSLLILALVYKKTIRHLIELVWITGFSLVLTSPWWLTILIRHGFGPFLAFAQAGFSTTNGISYLLLLTIRITDEPFLTIWGALILLGIMISIFEKKFWPVIWFLTPMVISPRSSPNLVVIPATVLITNSIQGVILPRLTRVLDVRTSGQCQLVRTLAIGVFFVFLFFYFLMSIYGIVFLNSYNYFTYVTRGEREAFDWINKGTKPEDKFLVLTQNTDASWGMDPISEWFPALTQRVSVSTPQGSEWLPEGEFFKKVGFYTQIENCYDKGLACIENVARNFDYFTHIYLYKPQQDESDNLPLIRQELINSDEYEIVYENDKASVFVRR